MSVENRQKHIPCNHQGKISKNVTNVLDKRGVCIYKQKEGSHDIHPSREHRSHLNPHHSMKFLMTGHGNTGVESQFVNFKKGPFIPGIDTETTTTEKTETQNTEFEVSESHILKAGELQKQKEAGKRKCNRIKVAVATGVTAIILTAGALGISNAKSNDSAENAPEPTEQTEKPKLTEDDLWAEVDEHIENQEAEISELDKKDAELDKRKADADKNFAKALSEVAGNN